MADDGSRLRQKKQWISPNRVLNDLRLLCSKHSRDRVTAFTLPDEDLEYLGAKFDSRWEMVSEGNKRGIIISKYKLPDCYQPSIAELMILIPPNYPVGMIDMFYFSPDISRKDGATNSMYKPRNTLWKSHGKDGQDIINGYPEITVLLVT